MTADEAEIANQAADRTTIEMEVEVPGEPADIWRAIAIGPGISSWYVPHQVEEREGGAATASFGPGMDVAIRVAAWDPPNRVVFDGGEGDEGLAFEWIVESADGGRCTVRLVTSGFGGGGPWDEMYDGMVEGWRMFLTNLRLHLQHFPGRTAVGSLPSGAWAGPRAEAWSRLTRDLGLPSSPAVGEQIEVAIVGAPTLRGTVVESRPSRLSLLLSEPHVGTGFLAAEGDGELIEVSIWVYLYGDEPPDPEPIRAAHAAWLNDRAQPTH